MGAPDGRSLTTSSKRKITSRGVVPARPLSGTILTTCGAAVSTGPPGGTPGDAHESSNTGAASMAVISTAGTAKAFSLRRAIVPSPPVAHVLSSIRLSSIARRPQRARARGP